MDRTGADRRRLGVAQVDRFAILNSTVIGDYDKRLRFIATEDELEALRELPSR